MGGGGGGQREVTWEQSRKETFPIRALGLKSLQSCLENITWNSKSDCYLYALNAFFLPQDSIPAYHQVYLFSCGIYGAKIQISSMPLC